MTEEGAARREAASMSILIVDDDQEARRICADVAREIGLKATTAASAEEAAVDIVLTDLRLPGTNGADLLRRIHDLYPDVAVVVLTQYGSIDSAVELTRLGAIDYVTKPFLIDELRSRLQRAMRAVELQQENRLL